MQNDDNIQIFPAITNGPVITATDLVGNNSQGLKTLTEKTTELRKRQAIIMA
jgi:hypothetical protein